MKYRVKNKVTFIGKDKNYPGGSMVDDSKEQVAGQMFKLIPLEDYVSPKRRTKPVKKYTKAVIEEEDGRSDGTK